MTAELELPVELTLQDGARHCYIAWRPESPEAVELAIRIACSKAASGYRFRGITQRQPGEQALWLAERISANLAGPSPSAEKRTTPN
jgi:hypothetical protein